jgi:hypothetical protein
MKHLKMRCSYHPLLKRAIRRKYYVWNMNVLGRRAGLLLPTEPPADLRSVSVEFQDNVLRSQLSVARLEPLPLELRRKRLKYFALH